MRPLNKCREKQPGCEINFKPWTANIQRQAVCQNPACLFSKAEKNQQKKEKKDRRKTREQKQAQKTVADVLREAQVYCNRAILLRDRDKPCVSCGTTKPVKFDSGHYRTVASSSELRFHPFNINKQCSCYCNQNKSGNIIEYRKELVRRIGEENVLWLEKHHDYYRYTMEDALEIKAHFMELCRYLKKEVG